MDITTLAAFCAGDDEHRGFLKKPFDVADHICVGTSSYLIFTPGHCNTPLDNADIAHTVQGYIERAPQCCDTIALTLTEIPTPCTITCPECKGQGEISFSTERHHYCAPCKECDGTLSVPKKNVVRLPGASHAYNGDFLHKLSSLGELQYACVEKYLYLTFSTGFAVVMPLLDDD